MCGIAGLLQLDGAPVPQLNTLHAMLERMRFRGPDDEGVYSEAMVAMGMVRLAIIDPEHGRQPIFDSDNTVGAVCNGEIYNYIELRAELQSLGHHFRCGSDTEVLVHGFKQWGIDGLLERVRGMFAFSIWDRPHRELHLARDPFGIKPLYYSCPNGTLVYASDLKSLLRHPAVSNRINLSTLRRYLAYGYAPGPETFCEDIVQLLPGHRLSARVGAEPEVQQYWNLSFSTEHVGKSQQELLETIDGLVSESVRLHMRSDVPLGILLSSGMDSATVLSYMVEHADGPVKTFTLDFEDPRFSEGTQAALVSRHFGTEHRQIRLGVPTIAQIEEAFGYYDQPNFDYSCIPTFLVSKFAREHVKVALMGDGGDELFAGYPTAYLHRVTPFYSRIPEPVRRNVLTPLIERLPTSFGRVPLDYKLKRFIRGADAGFERGHYSWKLLFDDAQAASVLRPEVWAEVAHIDPFAPVGSYFGQVAGEEALNRVLYVDAKTFLVDDLLVKADRMTMASSLEARVPFLDRQVAEFMCGVTERQKLPGFETKWLLRRLAERRLPAEIRKLKKKGFSPPFAEWLHGPLRRYATERILDSGAVREYFDRASVARVLEQHFAKRADLNREIALLLSLAIWHNDIRQTIASPANDEARGQTPLAIPRYRQETAR
ncbi:MAG: asparagine synthase (glutamine-hydrolyzing) [Bdellovibrionales bacterium]|nr:asparagine synthase (glutamine-hydrolyzing) [Bdellovibrionales bacterium]